MIIDRYLFRVFFRVVLILFCSLAGLLIVIDSFNNLDELIACSRSEGGIWRVLADYYGARTLLLFDYMAGMLAMTGAMFAITWLQRSNELTALSAAGVPTSRLLRPIVLGAMLISGLGAINREWGLPSVRSQLSRDIKNWSGEHAQQFSPKYDPQSDVLLRGLALFASDRRIEAPNFRLPPEAGLWGKELVGQAAYFRAAEGERPAGWLLMGVHQPEDLAELESLSVHGRPLLLSPKNHAWLKPGECFVVSQLSFEELYVGSGWRHYLSTPELVFGLKSRALENSNELKILLHSRFLQPLLDLVVLFLGLPLVLRRDARKIFVTAGMSMTLVGTYYAVTLFCRALGNNYLLSPALAAWAPLLAFGPVAFVSARPLWD
jgi:lipopolysaccharide export system permease protein